MHFRRASRRRCDLDETDRPQGTSRYQRIAEGVPLNAADHPGLDAANHHQGG
jgi:hypothetical protein